METDEFGILTQKAVTEIAFKECQRAVAEKDWPKYTPGLAIARAQHDHDVGVVKKCYKTPSGVIYPDFQRGWDCAIDCVLPALKVESIVNERYAALKAGKDGSGEELHDAGGGRGRTKTTWVRNI